ncbi:hypothetical protein KC345_g10060 [Hortaea werneckii]|nr:hypothetical protein KC345_g10060 [Hortaea werneckii]
MDSGTVAASVPIAVPTTMRVNGIRATTSSRNGNERITFTMLFSTSDRYLGADVPDDIQLMGNDDYSYTQHLIDMAEHIQNICRGARIKRGGRLVAQQQLRIVRQRPGNRYPLALPAAEPGRILVRFVRQPDKLQTLQHPLHPPGMRHPGKLQRNRHVPANRGIAYKIELLKDHAHSLPLLPQHLIGKLCKQLAVYSNRSFVGPFQQIDQPQQRGLAGTACPDDPVNGACLHLKRHIIHRREAAVLQIEAFANLAQR